MKINHFIQLLFFCLLSQTTFGQLEGHITNENGEPLPFASIYVENTSYGTNSNIEGEYNIELERGEYQIVFQYIGYKQQIKSIRIGNEPIILDIKLSPYAIDLSEVIVNANAEDPAYPIIRKAIAKRKYYKNKVKEYSCDAYVKGNQKILDAPEKIMGFEIGDMEGTLDSNRQGIVYLSESISKVYYKQPQIKEVMTSSKVSGNDNGFSFNRASEMNFNFYESHIDIGRLIISPIANNAFSYYKYKLVGTIYDQKGRLINKIKVIPKRSEDPVFRGHIYIVEDLWNIQSTALYVTGSAIQQPILDTLWVKQLHLPVAEPDTWMVFSQNIDFSLKILKFKFVGYFTGVFSNYNLAPQLKNEFFNNEEFKVNKGSNEKDLVYWDSIRPMPLTVEETVDYVRKDSLQTVRKSKPYRDSVDAVHNKFKFGNLLFGYSYSKSYKNTSFSIGSPLATIQLNTVQGWYGSIDINYRKEFDEDNTRWFSFAPKIEYGLGDEKLRISAKTSYHFNDINFSEIGLSGGRTTAQFNTENSISPTINSLYTWLFDENYLKIYEKDFARIDFKREIVNGVFIKTYLEGAQRRALVNLNKYGVNRDEQSYSSNDPQNPANFQASFEEHEAITYGISFRLRYQQKYASYPNRKYIQGTKSPELWLHYRGGWSNQANNTTFNKITIQIKERYIPLGTFGISEFNIEGGFFFSKKDIPFMDYQHFNGNRTIFYNPGNYLESFNILPYYSYSTNDKYVEAHYQHHFNGFLLDKIPLIRKLNWRTVFKAGFLYTPENKDYLELSMGLENIGFGAFKLFRLDVVSAFQNGEYWKTGVRLGIAL